MNTNILISSSDIGDPTSAADVYALLQARGFNQDEYDIVAVLDFDANDPKGGFYDGGNFIYVGWIFDDCRNPEDDTFCKEGQGVLDEDATYLLAATIYHHEVGHFFGWEHEWPFRQLP